MRDRTRQRLSSAQQRRRKRKILNTLIKRPENPIPTYCECIVWHEKQAAHTHGTSVARGSNAKCWVSSCVLCLHNNIVNLSRGIGCDEKNPSSLGTR